MGFQNDNTCDTIHPYDNSNNDIAKIITDFLSLDKLDYKGNFYYYKAYDEGGFGS
jgi:hypothetical protein